MMIKNIFKIKNILLIPIVSFSFLFLTTLDVMPQQLICSTDVPVAIPDNITVFSELDIPDFGEDVVTDVNVLIQIDHTFDDDLEIFLTSPEGTNVELTTDNGGAGDNYGSTCPTPDFILDDDAATSVTDGDPPFIGTFSPEQSLSNFNNEDPMGTWTLDIFDDAGGDTGTLNCWCIELTTGEFVATAPAPTLSEWGFILFGLIAGGIGIWFVKRRQGLVVSG